MQRFKSAGQAQQFLGMHARVGNYFRCGRHLMRAKNRKCFVSEHLQFGFRLRGVGCALPLFDHSAIKALFQATQALSPKFYRLAHYALAAAVIANEQAVTAKHVQSALQEIGP